ncbi:hypothetical protein EU556_08060 [Hymenobacter fodinae]|uniref:Uncharacterized protein n=1 Tax=Hymenobacter fodinae TaxID=2510796 RepID=A0A4Z0P6Y8_9BACT|nr:hypothetical protein EU556_08060 [Hymenobacter fodinae]
MTYSICLPRYAPRYPLLWPPPSWQQVVAGFPLLPTPFLAACIAVLPTYTLSVVLLDAALAVPNVVVGGFITVSLAFVLWFINRNQATTDATNKDTKEAVLALTKLVTEMRMERKEDRVVVDYLKERQDKLEEENEVLRKSVHAFDVFIEVQKASGKFKPNH